MNYIDSYLSEVWNKTNISEKRLEENFWDVCRVLEGAGFLISDDAAVSAVSVGPFKIASTLDVQRKDLLVFFLETIVPAIFSKASGVPFEQVYSLYLLPAANLFISLTSGCYWIKDMLQWDVLMYIREKNRRGIYPTLDEIKKADEFTGLEEWQMEEAVRNLGDFENLLGDRHELITMDSDGRFQCMV